MTARPRWTLSEAAEHVDASRSTLRRRLHAGAFPGATQDPNGIWRIGVEDLLAAGFTMTKTWLTDPAQPGSVSAHTPGSTPTDPLQTVLSTERAQLENDLAHERAHTAQLRIELAAEKQLRAAAERNATDLRTALHILEQAPPKPRRRWWPQH